MTSPSSPPTGPRWRDGLLAADEPDPVGHARADGDADVLILCDHAGALVPRRLAGLGVPPAELQRHIALDIGALGVARHLSDALDAELLYQRYSRLVIDCNRPPHVPSAMPAMSDGTRIGANERLAPSDVAARVAEIFHPYHAAIDAVIARRLAAAHATVIVAVHSFTPVHGDHPGPRPWHVGLLFGRDDRLARPLIDLLEREGDLTVGVNEPYAVADGGDYAIPVHAERRGLAHVGLELRQDLIADADGQRRWARRLARVLPLALERVTDDSSGGAPPTS